MLTINQAVIWAKEQGKQALTDYEINLLLAHILGVTLTWLRIWPDKELTLEQQKAFEQLCQRRIAGEPIAYLLGEWSFWSFKLNVSSDTLIPRPETEHLVEWILQQFPQAEILTVADLGTGSGAIALALALERPQWRIIATDKSTTALDIAKINAKQLQLSNIEWYCGSWFEALPSALRCDVIVSNPPYIAPHDPHLLQNGLSFEPSSALVAADEGLADIKYLISHAKCSLKPQGWLMLEHGFDQGLTVRQLFEKNGFKQITTLKDYSGQERITFGQNELYL